MKKIIFVLRFIIIFFTIVMVINGCLTPKQMFISWPSGIILFSVLSIVVIIICKKDNSNNSKRIVLNICLIISILLVFMQLSYIIPFGLNTINNHKQKWNNELHEETLTLNDTLFYECGSYIYSYSEFLHCINIYKDCEYLKTYYVCSYMGEPSEAYVVDGIFYVEFCSPIQMIYAYKDGEYYGRLSFNNKVYVFDANENCIIEHEDVYYETRQPRNYNKYIFFTYEYIYYQVAFDYSDNVLESLVVNNGNIEAASFSLTSDDQVKIKNKSIIFTKSSTVLNVKTNLITYFYPYNKVIQLFFLIYSILQFVVLSFFNRSIIKNKLFSF